MNDLTQPQNATSPANPASCRSPLPDAWVGRIFGRLAALYGAKFSDLWSNADPGEVRATWAQKLAGFRDMPTAIAKALDACDSRPTPPNLPEFLALCRQAAIVSASAVPRLEGPQISPEEQRARAAEIGKIADRSAGFDFLAWARNPGSDLAMRAVVECAERKDERFVEILAQLKTDGVCDERGRLLKRWDVGSQAWVQP